MSEDKTVIRRDSFVTPSELFTKEPQPFEDNYARRCFRVLRMISVLHGKGFHGLRVFPYEYPLAYRLELYPAKFTGKDGVRFQLSGDVEAERLVARHSGANEARFFGWEDTTDLIRSTGDQAIPAPAETERDPTRWRAGLLPSISDRNRGL
jgi:hypothetical protein